MFATIILTPRAIIDGLADSIIGDLVNITSIKILWKKYWQMGPKQIYAVYPKLKDKQFCNNLVRNLTLDKSLILLVSGKDIYHKMTKAKGKFQVIDCKKPIISGLRLKYRACDKIVNKTINNPVNDLFFEYRLHTTDSLRETITILVLCMNNKDLEKLYKVSPKLYRKIINAKKN